MLYLAGLVWDDMKFHCLFPLTVLSTLDDVISVAEQYRTDAVDGKGENGQHSECPGYTNRLQHGSGREGVDQTSDTGSTGGDSIRERASFGKPLGGNSHTSNEQKAHSETETYSLGEEQLPD